MNICVAGWYFKQFDDFYLALMRISYRYPVYVVANREDDYLKIMGLPYCSRENTGLEWGAYNHYLMNIWDDESNVLFCHDDIILHPLGIDYEIHPGEKVFEKIAQLPHDQAYIFQDRRQDAVNHSMHGRMIFMSPRLLEKFKDNGGFWYDENNWGYITGDDEHLKNKMDCYGYNAAILKFHHGIKESYPELDIHNRVYMPNIEMMKRGKSRKVA